LVLLVVLVVGSLVKGANGGHMVRLLIKQPLFGLLKLLGGQHARGSQGL
jgi:hypothetical protein